MTAQEMVERIKARSHHQDDTKIIGELASALSWAYTKIYNSEGGPDLLGTWGTELTMSAYTREYDLGANVTGTLAGVKMMWLKFTNDVAFTPMRPADSTSLPFLFNDQWAASDTTTVASGHPVYYDVQNFAKVRFSPPLPSGAVIRVDFWRKPPAIDPTTNNDQSYGTDIPEPAHEAIVDRATAQIWDLMDDTRSINWYVLADRRLADAMYLMRARTQGPTQTQPYRVRRRRYI